MIIKNQQGVTLVEVLATIIILSLVTILTWNIFFQGTKYSQKTISKNQMQQEANNIIANLNAIHKHSIEYSVSSNDCRLSVVYTKTNMEEREKIFENSQMCIQANNFTVNLKNSSTQDIYLTVEEKNNPNNKVEVNTLLSRLKEEKKE